MKPGPAGGVVFASSLVLIDLTFLPMLACLPPPIFLICCSGLGRQHILQVSSESVWRFKKRVTHPTMSRRQPPPPQLPTPFPHSLPADRCRPFLTTRHRLRPNDRSPHRTRTRVGPHRLQVQRRPRHLPTHHPTAMAAAGVRTSGGNERPSSKSIATLASRAKSRRNRQMSCSSTCSRSFGEISAVTFPS